jgi:hypothetical protein
MTVTTDARFGPSVAYKTRQAFVDAIDGPLTVVAEVGDITITVPDIAPQWATSDEHVKYTLPPITLPGPAIGGILEHVTIYSEAWEFVMVYRLPPTPVARDQAITIDGISGELHLPVHLDPYEPPPDRIRVPAPPPVPSAPPASSRPAWSPLLAAYIAVLAARIARRPR